MIRNSSKPKNRYHFVDKIIHCYLHFFYLCFIFRKWVVRGADCRIVYFLLKCLLAKITKNSRLISCLPNMVYSLFITREDVIKFGVRHYCDIFTKRVFFLKQLCFNDVILIIILRCTKKQLHKQGHSSKMGIQMLYALHYRMLCTSKPCIISSSFVLFIKSIHFPIFFNCHSTRQYSEMINNLFSIQD